MALGRLDWGQAPHDPEAVGQGPHSDILHAVPDPQRPAEATTVDDTELMQATPQEAPAVRIIGVINTRPVPTIAAGSQSVILSSALRTSTLGGNDPRRANMTVISTQSFFLSSSKSQCEQGFCALIPANAAVVLTHRDFVFVSAPAGNTFPQTISVLSENWAQ